MAADPLVTIDRFFDPIEARIVAGRLEASGIPVQLLDIQHASANSMIVVALGGIRLQVPSSCLEEAKRLLAEDVALDAEADVGAQRGSAETPEGLPS
jgi:hypothetical protein